MNNQANTLPRFAIAALAALAFLFSSLTLQAQSGDQPLPPALQAAVNSKSASDIEAAIATLADGDPNVAAQLAQLVVNAATALVATDPNGAVQVALGAARAANSPEVIAAAPAIALAIAQSAVAVAEAAPASAAALRQASIDAGEFGGGIISDTAMITFLAEVTATIAAQPAVIAVNPAVAAQITNRSGLLGGVDQSALSPPAPPADTPITTPITPVDPSVQSPT